MISITDGQIFLESDLFNAGVRPAINVGISVSRVGGAAQIKAMKNVAGYLKLDLAQYRELEAFSQFASDLDKSTQRSSPKGERSSRSSSRAVPAADVSKQIFIIFAGKRRFLMEVRGRELGEYEDGLYDFAESKDADIWDKIVNDGKFGKKMGEDGQSEVTKQALEILDEYTKTSWPRETTRPPSEAGNRSTARCRG